MILAGDDFAPFAGEVAVSASNDRVIVRERVLDIEDYLQAADLGLFTSDSESFCLSILEAMWFGCPSVATARRRHPRGGGGRRLGPPRHPW